ncbi:uncharacterized oxidoreductase SSP0419-like [Calliphora vicina]|uniref:uncharacterized oxidoreductase SSP0419-like n=1 Tax=Calliphora vicina TaxID=7373 RepID=UPI00325BDE2A
MLRKIVYFELFYGLHLIGIILLYPILILIVIVKKIKQILRNVFAPKYICGQVAVITGAGRGLGRDIAKELASRGCHIAVVDIQEQLALETAKFLTETYDVKTKAYKIDIRDFEQLQKLRVDVTADLGVPTILINNAGFMLGSALKNPPPQEIKQMIDVNFTALCYTLQTFLPKMKQINQGYIVNICSLAALFTFPILDIYGATKAAVRSLTSSLRIECLLEGKNIQATTVMPTFLTTNKRAEEITNLGGVQHSFPLMDGEVVAKYVINGMLSGSREITVPSIYLYVYQLLEILPVHIKELMASMSFSWNYDRILKSTNIADIMKQKDLVD